MRDVDAAEDWLDSWVAGVDAHASRTAQLARQVAALTARASSDDGSITVTVGSSGQVEDLAFDDRVQRLPGPELARRTLAVMRAAQQRLSAQVAEQVQQTVGADTETGRAVIGSFEQRFPAAQEPGDER
ncbi:YbaB/EbfC family nucleoid-associated protein [Actinoplanes sp. URMC 104]|uniref:YbaB/EbfC family nucleoid-associated protein n=1 Tax=Actinoplanes sp. URMC 104 TaxID=3423409 RepID=UPI003F1A8712